MNWKRIKLANENEKYSTYGKVNMEKKKNIKETIEERVYILFWRENVSWERSVAYAGCALNEARCLLFSDVRQSSVFAGKADSRT